MQSKFSNQIQQAVNPYGGAYNMVVAGAEAGAYGYGGGYGPPSGAYNTPSGSYNPSSSKSSAVRFNPMARPVPNVGGPAVDSLYGVEPVKVFVYNIGENATDSDLYGLFAKYGRITKVDVMHGKGYGFVHMPIPYEAQTAIRMLNRTEYNGRTLQVSVKT